MNLEILLSCMHQRDFSVVFQSHIQSDVIVINQCDETKYDDMVFFNEKNESYKARMFSTTERGLSRSRNMAIKNATGDICLLCDDDEILVDDYANTIIQAFEAHPNIDILAFIVNAPHKSSYPKKAKNVGYVSAMKISSWQIAFRRTSIVANNIRFDEKMGSGTGNGGGEENKFLFDCLKKKLKIRYIPYLIASVSQTDSKWFRGYTNEYFYNRGYSNRRLLGVSLAWLYGLYFSVVKYGEYKVDNTFWNALTYQLKGVFKKCNS